MSKQEIDGRQARAAVMRAKRLVAAVILAAASTLFVSGESASVSAKQAGVGTPTGRSTANKRCDLCDATDLQVEVLDCRVCRRPFCVGCAYLMRGDDFCCKECAYAYVYPDEGHVYVGGELKKVSATLPTLFSHQVPSTPPRRTRPEIRRAKIDGLDFKKTRLPDDYPDPYPLPYWPKLPLPGHPIPLEGLYHRAAPQPARQDRESASSTGADASERLVYQTNHESKVYIYRLRRQSDPRLSMEYPRYPWNDEGTICVPPPKPGYGCLAGDGSALPAGTQRRMTRHYRHLENQLENCSSDLRKNVFNITVGNKMYSCDGPAFGPEVAEAGGSHGEQGWTPAPGAETVYYWPVALDPYTAGNLGGALNYRSKGDHPQYLLGMQGWLIRPGREPSTVKFYEGPYISHESLAYYRGPAEEYPGFDRNRIAMIAWWAPPRLREYRVYDGCGKLVRTCATKSDRVHMAWGDHGNYLVGDSGYDWKHPGAMTVFFPDSGAIRPIGYHDNAYLGQKGTEHPHPAVSPDGTKLLYKSTHMDQLHGLEIMVIRPPRRPMLICDKGTLAWHVPRTNSEIVSFRIFHSHQSGRDYRFVAEIKDTRSPTEKLNPEGDTYRHRWRVPEGMTGCFLVCSVEGSGLMSPPSNEVVIGTTSHRRCFVSIESILTERRTAYIVPDGEAASWAVVRQTTVELRPGETQAGDPRIAYQLNEPGPHTVYVRLRGEGRVSFGSLGAVFVNSDRYVWQKLTAVDGHTVKCRLDIPEGVRLDQLCCTTDPHFVPAGRGALSLKPGAPSSLRVERLVGGTVRLTWKAPILPYVKEYNVYAVTGAHRPSQKWRICTVRQPRALDWNLPNGTTGYYVTAVGWDMSESEFSNKVTVIF